MRIGFIGLGNTGRPMARHLILAGLELGARGRAWCRRRGPLRPRLGLARDVGVPAELSALVEQVFRRAEAAHGDLAGEMSPVRLYETWAGQDFRLAFPTVSAV